jgi:hypothetical protein
MNNRIKELSDRAVELTQNRPNGTCEMSKYNEVFAQLIIDECCDIVEHPDPRIVPKLTWQVYEHFEMDWKDKWYTDEYGMWRKIK